MFARAAFVGRATRERARLRDEYLHAHPKIKPVEPPFKQRCFIPCLKGPWSLITLGVFIIISGATMCNFAYNAAYLTREELTSGNSTIIRINHQAYMMLNSLTFIGPLLMGFGSFCIILACVSLFDERDKILHKIIAEMERKQREENSNKTQSLVITNTTYESNSTGQINSNLHLSAPRNGSTRECSDERLVEIKVTRDEPQETKPLMLIAEEREGLLQPNAKQVDYLQIFSNSIIPEQTSLNRSRSVDFCNYVTVHETPDPKCLVSFLKSTPFQSELAADIVTLCQPATNVPKLGQICKQKATVLREFQNSIDVTCLGEESS